MLREKVSDGAACLQSFLPNGVGSGGVADREHSDVDEAAVDEVVEDRGIPRILIGDVGGELDEDGMKDERLDPKSQGGDQKDGLEHTANCGHVLVYGHDCILSG